MYHFEPSFYHGMLETEAPSLCVHGVNYCGALRLSIPSMRCVASFSCQHVSSASRLRSAADVGTQSWLNESARHADDGPLAAHAHSEAEREVGAEETANEDYM